MNVGSCLENIMEFSFSKDCMALMVSKLLGYTIIAGSFVLKVPQIKSLYKIKSDEGLSYLSMYVEIYLLLISSLYPYHKKAPFSTYGETVIILVQSMIILLLAWKYAKNKISFVEKFMFLLSINLIIYFCINEKLNDTMWNLVASSNFPLLSVSRISQIYKSYVDKSTGSLSMFTFLLALGGNLARIFTIFTESYDFMIVALYSYASLLNLVIIIQIILYESEAKKALEKLKNE